MTGPEHYREAERLTEAVTKPGRLLRDEHGDTLALAQVHATLALAAAQALRGHEGLPSRDRKAWFEVTATPEPAKAVA